MSPNIINWKIDSLIDTFICNMTQETAVKLYCKGHEILAGT